MHRTLLILLVLVPVAGLGAQLPGPVKRLPMPGGVPGLDRIIDHPPLTTTTADAWLDKVFRLRSSGYVEPGKEPQTEMVFAVKLELEDSKPVKIEVLRGSDEKGEEAWFARSEYTRGLVTLNAPIAADAAADLATLFTAE